MARLKKLYVIFAFDETNTLTNFYPIGAYETIGQAKQVINTLPKTQRYDLFKIPVNKFFGNLQGDKVNSYLGALSHEHFNIENE